MEMLHTAAAPEPGPRMNSPLVPSATEQAFRFVRLAQPGRQQFLVIRVGALVYGLPFGRVAEVCMLGDLLLMSQPPDYSGGSFILHGKVTPMVDLRVCFGAPATLDRSTRLVVCWRRVQGEEVSTGLLVDHVIDLLTIDGRDLRPLVDFMPGAGGCFVIASHGAGEARTLILDPDYLPR